MEQEQKKITELHKDLPVLQEVVNGTWTNESRLGELKTELAAIDRKILLSIAPQEIEEQKATIKINDIQEKPSLRLRAM